MSPPRIVTLIPARMGSSRFPGKPMATLHSKPMIGHVYERASASPIVTLTAVATCDSEIADYIESIGGKAIMTSNRHERASDRCAEALAYLQEQENNSFDIVVMVQGDEPMLHSEMISEAVQPMIDDPTMKVVNLGGAIESAEEFQDPNCIKVVCDNHQNAVYFSRQPIPTCSFSKNAPIAKQVCVIPFRAEFLHEYMLMKPTPLEIAESIDMLRILEHGFKVRIAPTRYQTKAVDTPEDLKVVSKLLLDAEAHKKQ